MISSGTSRFKHWYIIMSERSQCQPKAFIKEMLRHLHNPWQCFHNHCYHMYITVKCFGPCTRCYINKIIKSMLHGHIWPISSINCFKIKSALKTSFPPTGYAIFHSKSGEEDFKAVIHVCVCLLEEKRCTCKLHDTMILSYMNVIFCTRVIVNVYSL